MTSKRIAAAFAVGGLALALPAQAQLFRAYLSTKGNDANPCTLPAPCRLLPAALGAVSSGGEIWMLDSANYNTGPVTIDKAVTILAVPGAVGSVVSTNGNALNVTATAVNLRNLAIGPLVGTPSLDGIVATGTATLSIEKCVIANLAGWGLVLGGSAQAFVTDTVVRDNEGGIQVTGAARAALVRMTVSGHNSHGMYLSADFGGEAQAYAVDSVFDGNLNGVTVKGGEGRTSRATLARTSASGNASYGFYAYTLDNNPPQAVIDLSESVATRNAVGFGSSQALFRTSGNNRAAGNLTANTSGSITPTASR